MTRFLRTFLFACFIGNAFAVAPRVFGRFAGLDVWDAVQRTAISELAVIACAYLFAIAWVAMRMRPRRVWNATEA